VLTGKDLTEREVAALRADTEALFEKGGPWREELMKELRTVIREKHS
jgi:hypothetical protein